MSAAVSQSDPFSQTYPKWLDALLLNLLKYCAMCAKLYDQDYAVLMNRETCVYIQTRRVSRANRSYARR